MVAKKSSIHINPANKGKLRSETGTKKGDKIPVSKLNSILKSGTPAEKKRANFAKNARKWGK